MSALVIPFPRRSPIRAICRQTSNAAPFSPSWLAEHAPLVEAGLQLMACDDPEFSRRCVSMRDEDGRGLLAELARQLERLGSHLSDVADSLSLTAERIRGAMAPA